MLATIDDQIVRRHKDEEYVHVYEQGVFAFDELVRVYTAEGKGNEEKKIKNTLSQWKSRGYIEDLPDGKYRKVKKE